MKNFQFGVIKRPLRSTSINENKSFCLFAYSSFLTPLVDIPGDFERSVVVLIIIFDYYDVALRNAELWNLN